MTATKSNAPWSVKGIERDARDTAKEAAQREGMTVGAWLNQMIYSAGSPQSSGGVVEGLKLKDVITAIEALNNRVVSAESASSDAVDKLVRNFGGVVERVQRLERGTDEGSLTERLSRLEEKSQDRQRIDTLKALEKAVGQVALQFDSAHRESLMRLDAQEKQLQQMAGRLEGFEGDGGSASAVNYLKNAVDGLAARIARAERIASEASKISADTSAATDAEFVERTGKRLRVLGDEIKRGGDQIKTLESTIVKLSAQIDAAEKRSAEGVQKVSETIVDLREQFSTMDAPDTDHREEIQAAVSEISQRTDERINTLQQSFDDMISRLEQSEFDPDQLENADKALADGALTEDVLAAAQSNSPPPADADDNNLFDADDALSAIAPDADARIDLDADDASDADDEFNIDLDDEDPVHEETDDILSEVREAYGVNNQTADDETADDETPAPETRPADLDDVLAELEGLSTITTDAPAVDPAPIERKADAFLGDLNLPPEEDAPEADTPVSSHDAVKAARAAAKKAALAAETEQKPKTKRQLTPKQRAILAARIKRKRMEAEKAAAAAEEAEEEQKAAPSKRRMDPAKSALLADDFDDEDDDKSNTPSFLSKFSGALAGLASRLPGQNNADNTDGEDEETEAPASDDAAGLYDAEQDSAESDDPDISGGAKKILGGVTSRPIILALGAAILLAVVAVFFIAKDLFLSSPAPQQPIAVTAPQPGGADTPSQSQSAEVEVPEAPAALQPRNLYLENVAALQLARTPAEEAAAIQNIQEAAALGHPPAQLQLGEFYKTGQGLDQDLTQARIWYERAAAGGNVLAMHRAGVMTAQGEGGPADMNAAIDYFEQAGNRALVDSQYNLGAIYHPGEGGAEGVQNIGQAYYWYSLAAKNGDDQAASLAAGLSASLDADMKTELDASVTGWAPVPANPTANEVSPAS